MCVRAMDSNISSKQKELEKLLEVLRIKAETYVMVWDHVACLMGTNNVSDRTEDTNITQGKKLMTKNIIKLYFLNLFYISE